MLDKLPSMRTMIETSPLIKNKSPEYIESALKMIREYDYDVRQLIPTSSYSESIFYIEIRSGSK